MTPEERELRVKYVDWCSARVAEHLLELSPEEAFDIAERASQPSSGRQLRMFDPGRSPLSYPDVVRALTRSVSADLDLPGFAEWASRYREDPSSFERELLGFRLDPPSQSEKG